MNLYGTLYYKGEIVSKSKEKAAEYFKKSFENGDLDGMCNYACVLFNGEGVKSSINKSIEYLQTMAIDKQHLNGMNKYGMILLKGGEGILIDFKKKALQLFKTAADRGCSEALYNYANCLTRGIGIESNKEEAYRYF